MYTRTFQVLFIFLFAGSMLQAQTLGEFKDQEGGYGAKQLKKAEKKIYISSFKTNFEIYKDAVNYKAEGMFSNGGGAKAMLAVGLDGPNPAELQRITNELYNDYVNQLKSQGFEIISVEEAGRAESHEDYELREGGQIIPTKIPGFITSTPAGLK